MQTDDATSAAIMAAIEAEAGRDGPLLPILHRIQHDLGHVPEAALPLIAEALGVGRAEVHGAMSFYPDFRTAPVETPVVKICRAEACQAQGGRDLEAAAEGLRGRAEVEPVYCLGLCANGPAAMVGARPMAAASVEKIEKALAS